MHPTTRWHWPQQSRRWSEPRSSNSGAGGNPHLRGGRWPSCWQLPACGPSCCCGAPGLVAGIALGAAGNGPCSGRSSGLVRPAIWSVDCDAGCDGVAGRPRRAAAHGGHGVRRGSGPIRSPAPPLSAGWWGPVDGPRAADDTALIDPIERTDNRWAAATVGSRHRSRSGIGYRGVGDVDRWLQRRRPSPTLQQFQSYVAQEADSILRRQPRGSPGAWPLSRPWAPRSPAGSSRSSFPGKSAARRSMT